MFLRSDFPKRRIHERILKQKYEIRQEESYCLERKCKINDAVTSNKSSSSGEAVTQMFRYLFSVNQISVEDVRGRARIEL